jgi:hypothetical protein
MKRKIRSIFYSAAAILFTTTVHAQTDSTAKEKTKPQLKLSVNYNSNLNYYGRTDSLKSNGVFPMAEFWINPEFYINAAPIFVNNDVQKMDYAGTVTTIGYQHMTEKWLTNLYLLKPFYKQGSQLVQSALKAQSGLSLTKLNKTLNFTMGGDVKFSDKVDFGATAGIDHIIRKEYKDSSILVFDPAFTAYAGTQQFSRTYTQKKNSTLPLPGTPQQQQTVTEQVKQFNILAYEFSVPVIYVKKKWQFLATPSFIIPQNLLTVPNRPDLSEHGSNTFYVTAGIKYTL